MLTVTDRIYYIMNDYIGRRRWHLTVDRWAEKNEKSSSVLFGDNTESVTTENDARYTSSYSCSYNI